MICELRSSVCEGVGRPSVRLSVCPAVCAIIRRRGGFAAMGPAGRRYRSIAAWLGPQQQMQAVSRCQLTQEAKHKLVFVLFLSCFVLQIVQRLHVLYRPKILGATSAVYCTTCGSTALNL